MSNPPLTQGVSLMHSHVASAKHCRQPTHSVGVPLFNTVDCVSVVVVRDQSGVGGFGKIPTSYSWTRNLATKKIGDQITWRPNNIGGFWGFSCNWRLFWSPILLGRTVVLSNIGWEVAFFAIFGKVFVPPFDSPCVFLGGVRECVARS